MQTPACRGKIGRSRSLYFFKGRCWSAYNCIKTWKPRADSAPDAMTVVLEWGPKKQMKILWILFFFFVILQSSAADLSCLTSALAHMWNESSWCCGGPLNHRKPWCQENPCFIVSLLYDICFMTPHIPWDKPILCSHRHVITVTKQLWA